MSQTVEQSMSGTPLFEAVVAEVEPGRVQLRRADDATLFWARTAVLGYTPRVGDRVVCSPGVTATYITGVLIGAPLELRAGDTSARVEEGRFVVRGQGGELLVSFDPESRTARLSTEAATLRLESDERIELRAPDVNIRAERLTQEVEDLVTDAQRVAVSTSQWNLRANRIAERAKNVFRDAEALLQTRAGTLRTIARASMSLYANRTSIRSKKDTAVDGERVLLG